MNLPGDPCGQNIQMNPPGDLRRQKIQIYPSGDCSRGFKRTEGFYRVITLWYSDREHCVQKRKAILDIWYGEFEQYLALNLTVKFIFWLSKSKGDSKSDKRCCVHPWGIGLRHHMSTHSHSSKRASSAVVPAETVKGHKYRDLSSYYLFVPFRMESLGPWSRRRPSILQEYLIKN